MEYSKSPKSHIQQIEMLKERGLLIRDEEHALKQLNIISYFRLANYLRPMELDKVTHQFKPNSYFENALSLYYFDKKLRALVFTAIQSIEISLRTRMIHMFP
jgi:abortive infection bacteriophage resistance protein